MEQKPVKEFLVWQNNAISRVLQVTLKQSDADQNKLFLSDLSAELQEESGESNLGITQDLLDRVVVARLSHDPSGSALMEEDLPKSPSSQQLHVPLFDYLLGCWKRASEVKKGTLSRQKNLGDAVVHERIQVLEAIKKLCVSYAGIVLQMPEMFPQPASIIELGGAVIVPKLLKDPDSLEGVPLEFLEELSIRFQDDGIEEVLGPAFTGISAVMRSQTLLSDFRTPLRTLSILTSIKPLAALIPKMPNWNPGNLPSKTLELVTLLGPFFKLSVFPEDDPSIADLYFSNPSTKTHADIQSSMISLRGTLQNLHSTLFNIMNSIVRASPESRQSLLEYYAEVIRKNEKRAQMQVDRKTVSSDGYMTNLTATLLKFCDPFLDAQCSKIDRVDPDYFRKSKLINIAETTKINATQEESDSYYKEAIADAKAPNFISDIFFLTVDFHHYGLLRSFAYYNNFIRDFSEMRKQYERMKEDAPRWANTPTAALNEEILKRCKAQLEKQMTQKLCLDTQLLDSQLLLDSMRFYNFVMNWLIRLVDPKQQHPWTRVSLPLPTEISERFAMLPEYIIEDIAEFFLFVARYNPNLFSQTSSCDDLINFIVTFIGNSKYIKNPYLKAKLVEILFFFTLPFPGEPSGGLAAYFDTNTLALEHLMPALMKFYVEVEQTGLHSQFYDKFNIRYNISQVLKAAWKNQIHKERLAQESGSEMFVRFINLLINDTTYLLDEGLSKLSEIHTIQKEMADTVAWNQRPNQERTERETLLQQDERQAQSCIALGNETVNMLCYLTESIVDPFMTPEIVDRLAAMLNYNLNSMVGPKCTELKVRDPEKYQFKPRRLLSDIVSIYLHLNRAQFVQAIARDTRSYQKELFVKAAGIMSRFGLKLPDEIMALRNLINEVETKIASELDEEEELGEVPDEFLDPLMYSVMEDPVILPTSNITVDRSTIKSHLLSDSIDPFNRKPLTIDMVIPNTELKERILAFKQQKRQDKLTQSEAATQ
ncbi:Ubiquitin conjugation factor E4 [Basidiobolus ranarum]|uniref:Ubiquitin conjugation factor E4 n=1 Tax=Basidiobolus ranarum TaxID=34480 RepID=A0ABR2W7R2_9FUNG